MAAPRPKGNDRTDQAKTFTIFDNVHHTRYTLSTHTNEAEVKAQQAASPLDGGMDMTNLAERWGRPLQVNNFIATLQRLNPMLIFELSTNFPDKYGIYIERLERDPITGSYSRHKRHVGGMISGAEFGGIGVGFMPEFSIILNETEVVPDSPESTKAVKKFKREIRGWRTVLARLLTERLITEAQIEKTFKISEGPDSSNWQKRVNSPINIDTKSK